MPLDADEHAGVAGRMEALFRLSRVSSFARRIGRLSTRNDSALRRHQVQRRHPGSFRGPLHQGSVPLLLLGDLSFKLLRPSRQRHRPEEEALMTVQPELTDWNWLKGTYWYVFPKNLPALQYDAAKNTLAWVVDQTV